MLYHITFTDRYTGKTEVGRVSVGNDPFKSAAKLRSQAIVNAAWKYPNARRATISAVCIRDRVAAETSLLGNS